MGSVKDPDSSEMHVLAYVAAEVVVWGQDAILVLAAWYTCDEEAYVSR